MQRENHPRVIAVDALRGFVLLFNWPGALAMVCLGYLATREHWLNRLRRFQTGPVEWLLRSFSHLHLMPI